MKNLFEKLFKKAAPAETAVDTENTEAPVAPEKKVRSADLVRRLRHGRLATIITVGVIALILLVNVLFYALGKHYPLNLDVTSNQIFSLSDESMAIAGSLTEKVEIVVFTPEDVFSDVNSDISRTYHGDSESIVTIFNQFYNATRKYVAATNGLVSITYIDMNTNPTAYDKYNSYKKDSPVQDGDILFISEKGSRCVSIIDLCGDIDQEIYSYYGILVANSSMVEQVLASNLKAVQSEKEMVISLAIGYDEDGNTMTALQNLYTLNGYSVENVNLTGSAPINANTVCLVIPAPSTDYTKDTVEKLRTWLSNDGKEGRNLLVFTHPQALCPNLYEFLKVDYGMEVTNNVISETDLNYVYQNNPYGTYGKAVSSDYTANSGGDRILAPLCRQIIPHWEAQTDESFQYSVNLLTFSSAARITPLEQATNGDNPTASTYDGEIVGMAIAVKDGYQNALQVATTTKVAVCGSSSLTQFVQLSTVANESLLLDSMTKISGYVNPVNISSKSLATESVFFSTNDKQVWGDIVFSTVLPLAFLAVALVVFLRRRHL